MEKKVIKVAINGYGTIGKRVADAITLQDDMEVVAVKKTKPDYNAKTAEVKRFNIYTLKKNIEMFKKAGYDVRGALEDMLDCGADIIIDCTPAGIGALNKPDYEERGLPAIFQGGESADIAEVSFCACCNYDKAWGKRYVRVVSCNTIGICRTVGELDRRFGVEKVEAQMIRRGADMKDATKGPLGQIIPAIKDGPYVHGHHAADVKTIIPHLNIYTMAMAVPSFLMHVHCIQATLKKKVNRDDIIGAFAGNPRILLLNKKDGFTSTGNIVEWARDFRTRYDIYEIVVWQDSIVVDGDTVRYYQAVHQEADVVPDNIDAVRAMFRLMSAEESMKKTNESLDIGRMAAM